MSGKNEFPLSGNMQYIRDKQDSCLTLYDELDYSFRLGSVVDEAAVLGAVLGCDWMEVQSKCVRQEGNAVPHVGGVLPDRCALTSVLHELDMRSPFQHQHKRMFSYAWACNCYVGTSFG